MVFAVGGDGLQTLKTGAILKSYSAEGIIPSLPWHAFSHLMNIHGGNVPGNCNWQIVFGRNHSFAMNSPFKLCNRLDGEGMPNRCVRICNSERLVETKMNLNSIICIGYHKSN